MLDRLGRRSTPHRRWTALLLASLLLAPVGSGLTATVAWAEEPASATTQQEAKKLFQAGVKSSKAGNYQEALAAFLESNRLVPREGTLRNIIRAHRDLKDNAAAYDACASLLALYGTKMTPAARQEAQQVLQELSLLTGAISIGVQEPGAKVTVDAKEVGQTPLASPVRVNMGAHAVAISKPGFDTLAQQVDLSPGHNSASIDGPFVREVLTGHLNVTALPADPTAKILVDGNDVGAPPWQGDLEPGPHTVQARSATALSETRPVDVAKKGSYDVNLTLRVQGGTVSVTVNTPDADIALDGKVAARGAFQQLLAAGRHALTVSKAGFVSYKKELVVSDGEKIVETVALVPVGGAVAAPHDWTGIYTQFNFIGTFGPATPQNDIAKKVGYTADTQVTSNKAAGGGLSIGVGYSFGFWALEGAVVVQVDHSAAQAAVVSAQNSREHPPLNPTGDPSAGAANGPGQTGSAYPYTEKYDFYHVGGDLTVGARLMPKTEGVRPTLGVGGGLGIKTACYNRGVSANSGADNTVNCAFTTYVAPVLRADGGIELGNTPGTRFYLGVLFLAELSGHVSSDIPATNPTTGQVNFPNPQINVVTGPEFYIGPILGIQFGE